MPYTDDPANNPIDRIRLRIGDTEEECEELSDSVYQYLLSLHNNNENRASLDALKAVLAKYKYMFLFKLSQFRHKSASNRQQNKQQQGSPNVVPCC